MDSQGGCLFYKVPGDFGFFFQLWPSQSTGRQLPKIVCASWFPRGGGMPHRAGRLGKFQEAEGENGQKPLWFVFMGGNGHGRVNS